MVGYRSAITSRCMVQLAMSLRKAGAGFVAWEEAIGLVLAPAYSLQRRKSSAPLVPPKPNELDMAYSSSTCRAWLGT